MVKAFPPLHFELTIKGAKTLDYRLERRKAFRIVGMRLRTTLENGECYNKIPAFWRTLVQAGRQEDMIALMNQEPKGLLGVSHYSADFSTGILDYYVACSTDQPTPDGMEEFIVPESTWAIFPCLEKGADAIQKLEHRIVMEWMPTSGYEFAKAPDIEVYASLEEADIWIPVKKI